VGLSTSKSTFKDFLQNLEGKFTKSSSKSKALIHYPTGCLRRHCMPDLFILSYVHSMDPADPCGHPSWSSQSLMHHRIFVTSSMEFMAFKRCKFTVMACCNRIPHLMH